VNTVPTVNKMQLKPVLHNLFIRRKSGLAPVKDNTVKGYNSASHVEAITSFSSRC
jgi:hypothetical protein